MTDDEKTIRELSDKAFAGHKITERARQGVFRSWRCQRPGTWTYGFDITTIPGSLVITGDIGDLIVSRTYDMLPWCRGSVDSTGYFAEKVPHGIQTREFSRAKLRAWIVEQLRRDDVPLKHQTILQHALEWELDDNGPDWFYREFEEIWAGSDPPNWNDWCSRFLWCRDAIRWFVRNHSEEEITQ